MPAVEPASEENFQTAEPITPLAGQRLRPQPARPGAVFRSRNTDDADSANRTGSRSIRSCYRRPSICRRRPGRSATTPRFCRGPR